MAVHKFILSGGGYFYRFKPNFPLLRDAPSSVKVGLFDIPPIADKKSTNQFIYLYGRFVQKYMYKHDYVIELEQKGKLLLADSNLKTIEARELFSTLWIVVDEYIYSHQFDTERIYQIQHDQVTDITPDT